MDDKQKSALGMLAAAGGIGLQAALAIAAGGFIGRQLDDCFGTSHWMMAAGILVGFVAGLWTLYRTVK